MENRAAHPHQEFRRGPPGDLGLDIRTPPTSFTSLQDAKVVTSECVIEPSEKGTQTSAIKAQKKARRLGRVGAREKHENAILSTELKTILNQRKKIEDN